MRTFTFTEKIFFNCFLSIGLIDFIVKVHAQFLLNPFIYVFIKICYFFHTFSAASKNSTQIPRYFLSGKSLFLCNKILSMMLQLKAINDNASISKSILYILVDSKNGQFKSKIACGSVVHYLF